MSPGASTPSPESTAGAAVGSGDQGGGGGEDGGREEGNGMSKRPVTTATGAVQEIKPVFLLTVLFFGLR